MRISVSTKLISSSLATGSRSMAHGLSVVPAMVRPSQGRKKMTRPSDEACRIPISSGQKSLGSTTCTPELGATSSFLAGSSSFSTASE